MRFSLVIPCYNEAATLPLLLERCRELAATPGVEVILVDNGSTDGSAEVLAGLLLQYPGCRSIRVERNKGYGFGILEGLRAAPRATFWAGRMQTCRRIRTMRCAVSRSSSNMVMRSL